MTNLAGALFYLRITSLKNAFLSRVKRLKQPKYLFGGVVGAMYLYFFFFRRMLANRNMHNGSFANTFADDVIPIVAAVGALFLLIAFVLCWVWPRERAALKFSEAEIAFLFPAPVARQTLIHYQLLSSQGRILFTAVIASFFSGRWSFLPGNIAIHIAGWWIIVSTVSLHVMGSSFVITRLLDNGVTSRRRLVISLGAVAMVVAGLAMWVWRDIYAPREADLTGAKAFFRYCAAMLDSGPLPWLLLPAKLILKPLLASDLRSFLFALAPAALIYAAHYLWVLKSEVSFEEASIAKAEKRAAKLAAFRQSGKYRVGKEAPKARRPPFNLNAAGRPELAFFWKNLLATAAYLRVRTALIAATIIVAGCTWFSGHLVYEAMRPAITIALLFVGGYLFVLGPQIARQDLRSDLPNTDIFKTYPLRGWQIVAGELLTPLAIITVLIWLVLLAVALVAQTERFAWLTPPMHIGIAISLALMAPLLCALQLLVLNTGAVLFPAWLQSSRQAGGGIDVMGQRLLFFAGNLIVVAVALLPATVLGSLSFLALQWMVGDVVATLTAIVVILAVLSLETWLGIRWLGSRFDRFDLSAELRG